MHEYRYRPDYRVSIDRNGRFTSMTENGRVIRPDRAIMAAAKRGKLYR